MRSQGSKALKSLLTLGENTLGKRFGHGHAKVWTPAEEAANNAEFAKRWSFNNPTAKEIKAGQEAIGKGQWKTFFIALPMGFVPALYILANEHHHEREVKYPYLRVRAGGRPYPWGEEDWLSVPHKGSGGHH